MIDNELVRLYQENRATERAERTNHGLLTMTKPTTTYTIEEPCSGNTYTTQDAYTAERWALAGLKVTAVTHD